MISLRTSTTIIAPQTAQSKDGSRTYYQTEVMEPKQYTVEFSPDGGQNVKQMQAVFEQCATDGIDLEIKYMIKNGRFGLVYVVFDLKPMKPKS